MRIATLILLVTCFAALPADADWLVLRDGSRVETEGAWTEKGRLVVFTSADGRLASLRADTVDLEASRRATATAEEAAAQPAPAAPTAAEAPRRESRRITNADIPAGRGVQADGADANGDDATAETPPAASGDLQVGDTAQQIDPFDNHLIVTGTLANGSQRTAAAVALTVQAFGADGELLGTESAALDVAALTPGATTRFEADFADVYNSAMALRFAPSASFLETGAPDEPSSSGEDAEDGFEDDDFDDDFDDFEDEP